MNRTVPRQPLALDLKVIPTARGPIEYDLSQGPGPTVLSVHAGLGGADQGRLIADWLVQQGYTVLSPSRPGYLGTPLTSGRTVQEQAELLVALLDALGIRQVILLSLSAGGPVAFTLAAHYPERVRALVAVSSVSGTYFMPETVNRGAEMLFMSSLGQRFMGWFLRRFPRAFLTGALGSIGYQTKAQLRLSVERVLSSPAKLAFMKGIMDAMVPYSRRTEGNRNDMEQFVRMGRLPLDQISCPCLIVHGTHDADVKFWDGVRAFEQIPHARRCWIEQGDHLTFWLGPEAEQAQATALAFLREHEATPDEVGAPA